MSKFLSWALRHEPDAAGISLDPAGWASVEAVLDACARHGIPCSREGLEAVVQTNDKRRFELSGERIRAVQGHSVGVALEYPPAEPPERLFHGTVARFVDAIQERGLIPGNRHAVHLSPDLETARAVGGRRGRPVILTVRAGELHRAGGVFRTSPNGVWLVDHVPPEFLEFP